MNTIEISTNGSSIHFDVAKEQVQSVTDKRHAQAVMLNRFRTEHCDCFSFSDFEFYAAETGKDVHWLFQHARFVEKGGVNGAFLNNAFLNRDHDLIENFFL